MEHKSKPRYDCIKDYHFLEKTSFLTFCYLRRNIINQILNTCGVETAVFKQSLFVNILTILQKA